jgi:hypothetical protein
VAALGEKQRGENKVMYSVSVSGVWFSLAWLLVGLVCGYLLPNIVLRTLTGRSRRGGATREEGGGSRGGGGEGGVELYVGNLAYSVSKPELEKAFGKFGKVVDVRIIGNRLTGKSRGYGFVVMADHRGAISAVKAMNGADFSGRPMVAKEAKSRARD